jgi:transcriptional regulator with XRE-family HTH domain
MRLRCRLREYRATLDLSLRELEAQTGVPRATLSRIENGRLLPTDRELAVLEPAYGRTFLEWYGTDDRSNVDWLYPRIVELLVEPDPIRDPVQLAKSESATGEENHASV